MTAFDAAMDVLASDVNWSELGTFTPAGGGSPVVVRCVRSYRDAELAFPGLDTTVRSPGWQACIPKADLPDMPTDGATLTIGATTYTLRNAFSDAERTEWVCELN